MFDLTFWETMVLVTVMAGFYGILQQISERLLQCLRCLQAIDRRIHDSDDFVENWD